MERVLSNIKCSDLITQSADQEWERVETVGHYDQVFVDDIELEADLESFFSKKFLSRPIVKVCKFKEGDYISTSTFDYGSSSKPDYQKYKDTNFVIQVFLNDNFSGGVISSGRKLYQPLTGTGLIQPKSAKGSISKISSGEAYYLFAFITGYQSNSIL